MSNVSMSVIPADIALGRLLDDIRRLVVIESPSSDLAAVERSARAVGALIAERLGAEAETLVIDGVTHLRVRFGDGPSRVLILTHHDTVWPIGTLERIPFEVEGDILTGPGSFDMKAGLVSGIHAIAAVLEHTPALDGVTLLVTGDEELGSPTSRELIEAEAAGCAGVLVLEAAADGGALKIARKGVSTYRVVITGRASHAGLEPELGVNAVVELAHQIVRIAALGAAEHGTTVTPTVVDGGTAQNTVPATASVRVDVRAATRAEQDRVDSAIRSLSPVLERASITVEGGPNRPPMEPEASAALFERTRRVAAEIGIEHLAGVSVGGGSDGNFTAGIGVPTLDGLGAVGAGAHADHEHVRVHHLPERTALVAALIEDLAGAAR
ncbi:M20 family metallopeptidase [Agromyces laixinhei]|uniref:M20 family metallopeptidase n=1 Tax=Agromyces laixinhei TaxID=2585717 RepID=UPI001F3021C6|nr:M20 family metallopeptidase [Agromyces laixinhei]